MVRSFYILFIAILQGCVVSSRSLTTDDLFYPEYSSSFFQSFERITNDERLNYFIDNEGNTTILKKGDILTTHGMHAEKLVLEKIKNKLSPEFNFLLSNYEKMTPYKTCLDKKNLEIYFSKINYEIDGNRGLFFLVRDLTENTAKDNYYLLIYNSLTIKSIIKVQESNSVVTNTSFFTVRKSSNKLRTYYNTVGKDENGNFYLFSQINPKKKFYTLTIKDGVVRKIKFH